MTAPFDTISFLSDYGSSDEFVGVVKSVVRDLAPHVTVIDLTHEIPPHDVRAGGLALARCIQYVARGVVLAVVDPGVGTDRKAVAVEVAGGEGVLVGPDNGLLASAVSMAGGAERAVTLTNPDYQLVGPGPTFAGRDVFAPAAAHLCNGVPLEALGEEVDPGLLMPGVLPVPHQESDGLHTEILWIDRYGNAQLNIGPDDLPGGTEQFTMRIHGAARSAVRAHTYGALAGHQLGLVIDSYGLVSIVLDRQSAAAELGVRTGDVVVLSAGDEPAGTTTRVGPPSRRA